LGKKPANHRRLPSSNSPCTKPAGGPALPPADPARKLATYDDQLALPEGATGEIIDGELQVRPRHALRHANASSELHRRIWGAYGRGGPTGQGPGGWIIRFEPELHLGRHVVIPDAAGWKRERLPTVPDRPWLDRAPD
jgi:hypothetical protein